ncbi:MAG: hypothetical protein H7124_16085 [Phycisphaerales bacterium]|nr:hypothetical protein [Hyphomonadaceae bacterium]
MTVNPYDIQPMQPQGSPQASLFRAVGRSLSAWEYMEYELSKLYEELIGARTDGAGAGYGTLISGAARLQLVSQAAEYFPAATPGSRKEIMDALKLVEKFGARRNDIAHGVCSKVKDHSGWYLIPTWYDTRKSPRGFEMYSKKFNFGVGLYAYNVEQIDAYADHFHAIRARIEPLVSSCRDELRAWFATLHE